MTLKKNLAKRGAWQTFSHSFILHSNYRICACPIPLEKHKHFKIDVVHLDTLLKEVLIGKINTLVWFRSMKKKSLMEDKRSQRGTEAPHSSEPQKAHPTGEFVVVT